MIVVWLSALSLNCEVDLVWLCALPLSVEVVFVERGVVYSQVIFFQILSGGSLCGKSFVDAIVEIFLCEGGDVELGARTSKHILVFAFDPLSLSSLSYFVPCIDSYCSFILICLILFVCAHTCVQPRELHIAPQLLFRGI